MFDRDKYVTGEAVGAAYPWAGAVLQGQAIQQAFVGGQGLVLRDNPLGADQHITQFYDRIVASLVIRKDPTGEKNFRSIQILAATDFFIIGGIHEADQEKMMPMYTLGDPMIYGGTGRQPRAYAYSGFIVDSDASGEAVSAWRKMYDRFLRGTRCVENKAYAEFRFRDQYRAGYVMSCSMAYEETRPQVVPFSFSIFVIKEDTWSPDYPPGV